LRLNSRVWRAAGTGEICLPVRVFCEKQSTAMS
jgi:hypothetical protein